MKEETNTMYVIVNKKEQVLTYTLAFQKKQCISNFLSESNMTWTQCKKYGWKCEKVIVNIKPFN